MDGSIFAYIAAGVTGAGLLAWRFRKPPTTYGSSAWLTIFQAFRRGLFKEGGLLVGDWTGLLPVYYDGTHAITDAEVGRLQDAQQEGVQATDDIAAEYGRGNPDATARAAAYLRDNVKYGLGLEEARGLQTFLD